ncbi:DUF3291 domain-containing protein [Pseudonocardia humida]|uniref:DUF3291 domain-containing protein n=1 Tax=Pseudonocardia humida TaxID=2800819 RepID=A0ABT1AA45_9PSEU|nr:DUF3291 domain-containing protein [Pseudonocardia humida]MCO1659912.1 DUF3291 domain-containing protein [Pseudonocardia humida]
MTASHLAQFNVARLRAPLDHPSSAGFMAGMDPMNDLADRSPGFVWRLTEDGKDNATGIRPIAPDVIITLSLWESLEALRAYAYHSEHLDYLRRRREWFLPHGLPAALVLWWVPVGLTPTVDEALERLDLLGTAGPTPRAFTFRQPFPAPTGPAVLA